MKLKRKKEEKSKVFNKSLWDAIFSVLVLLDIIILLLRSHGTVVSSRPLSNRDIPDMCDY